MEMMKRSTALLLAILLITAYASPFTVMAQEDMVIFAFPWPYDEAPEYALEEEAFPHDAHIQAFNDFEYFDIHEVTMASFEPFVLGAGGAMMQALKQAMPSMIMEAGGFGIGSDNAGDFMQAVMSMPIFCRQTWRDFGTFAFDLATEAGRSMQNTFNMVTDGLAIENRIRLRNPQTGEQRYGWSIPMHEVQTIFDALQQPLAEFIGPINLTEADAAWAAGVPFLHNRPAIGITNNFLGFYRGVPVMRVHSSNSERINVFRTHGAREAFSGNDIFTQTGAWWGPVPWATHNNTIRPGDVYRNGILHERPPGVFFQLRAVQSFQCTGFVFFYNAGAQPHNRIALQRTIVTTYDNGMVYARYSAINPRIAPFNNINQIYVPVSTPALDVFIGPLNIVTNPPLAAAHVGQVAGVQSDEDEVFFWWPNSLPEFLEMLEAARGAESVVVPQGWQVADDDDPPIIYPPLYPPITHPQNPAIPREWLENVERELAGIHSYAGAIAGTLAGEVDLNLSASDVAPYFWTTRFPFSIPFSYSRMIQSLWTTPQAPRFEFDFTGTILDAGRLSDRPSPPRVQENPVLAHSGMSGAVLVIDLRDFERIAVYARWGIFIAFAFGLLKSTNMFIRW